MASEASLPLEHPTQPDAAFFVHVEDENCGAAHRSQADNHNVGNLEMLFPGVLTWVDSKHSPQLAAGPIQMGNPKGVSIPFGRVRGQYPVRELPCLLAR